MVGQVFEGGYEERGLDGRNSLDQVTVDRLSSGPIGSFAPETIYNRNMEKRVRVYSSHVEADEADLARDAALTPQERLEILFELRNRRHPDAAEERLARVCRVTKLERS